MSQPDFPIPETEPQGRLAEIEAWDPEPFRASCVDALLNGTEIAEWWAARMLACLDERAILLSEVASLKAALEEAGQNKEEWASACESWRASAEERLARAEEAERERDEWKAAATYENAQKRDAMSQRNAVTIQRDAFETQLRAAEGERDAAVAGLEDLRALVRLKAASEIVAALNGEGT